MRRSSAVDGAPLARIPFLLAVAGVIAALLAVVFPRSVHQDEDVTTGTDAVSLSYLRLWLAERPDDASLRLKLAGAQLSLGKLDDAMTTLRPLVSSSGLDGKEARWLTFQAQVQSWRGIAHGTPTRIAERIRLGGEIERWAETYAPRERIGELVALSLEFERPDIAARLHLKTIPHLPEGAPPPAGVRRCEGTSARACEGLLAMDAARQSGSAWEAIRAAEQAVKLLPHEPAVLLEAVAVALAQNSLEQSLGWLRRLALIDARDATLRRLVDLELASGHALEALHAAEHVASLRPGDVAWERRIAELAEWAGRPVRALDAWADVARKERSADAADRARHLAEQLGESRLVCEMLFVKAKRVRLNAPEMTEAGPRCDAAWSTAHFADQLEMYLRRYPADHFAWKLLVRSHAWGGRLEQALSALRTMGKLAPALRLDAAMSKASLRWLMLDTDGALASLRQAASEATAEDTEYWRMRADLAWKAEAYDEAYEALLVLRTTEALDVSETSQLLELAADRGAYEDLVELALWGFDRFENERLVLRAMEVVHEGHRPRELRRLLTFAQRHETEFASHTAYWAIQAETAAAEGRKGEALAWLDRALALEPESAEFRTAFLWAALEMDDIARLRMGVSRWQEDANAAPSLWHPLAVALVRLGRHREALPFYERETAASPDDVLLLADFAEALERSGRAAAADRIRRRMWVLVRTAHQTGGSGADALAHDLVAFDLARRFASADKREDRLNALLQRYRAAPEAVDAAVDAFLSDGRVLRAAALLRHGAGGPASRLSLAQASGDRAGASRLLDRHSHALSPLARIDAYRWLGRDRRALHEAFEALAAGPHSEERALVAGHASELAAVLGTRWSLDTGGRSEGTLRLGRTSLTVETTFGRLSLAAAAGAQVLGRTDTPAFVASSDRRIEAVGFVRIEQRRERGAAALRLGGNIRPDSALLQVGFEHRRTWTPWLESHLSFALNDLDDAPPALRWLGAAHTAQADLGLTLDPHTRVAAGLGLRHTVTRDGASIANGVEAHLELERAFRAPPFGLRWKATADGAANAFIPALPGGLDGASLASPAYFASGFALGAGTRDTGARWPLPFAWHLEAWGGWLWFEDRPAFRLQLSASAPLMRGIGLTLDGFLANDQPQALSAASLGGSLGLKGHWGN